MMQRTSNDSSTARNRMMRTKQTQNVRSNIGTHDHENSRFDRNGAGTDQRHNNRCSRTRRLKHHRDENTHNEGSHRVGIPTKETGRGTSRQHLGTSSKELEGEDEPVEAEEHPRQVQRDFGPLRRSVDKAIAAYFCPCNVIFLFQSGGIMGPFRREHE